MKKSIILFIVFLLLFAGLIVYSAIFSYGVAEPLDLAENITMEIKEGTLTMLVIGPGHVLQRVNS